MLAMVGGIPSGGTRYMHEVLQACGIQSRHETALRKDPGKLWPHKHSVEVSWVCNAWFSAFDGPKILIVRSPLNVIRSQISWRFLQQPTKPDTYLGAFYPQLCELTGIRKLARFYIDWLKTGLYHCDKVIDVRNISQSDIRRFCDRAKLTCNPTGLQNIGNRVNTKHDYWVNTEFNWFELGNLYDELVEFCSDIGIEVGYGDLAMDKSLEGR